MGSRVGRLIFAVGAAAVLGLTAAFLLFPINPSIEGPAGIAFWTAATVVASALPVRLPRGTVVSVAAAPLIASMVLGGPVSAALVALLGTWDSREIRGQVPWYGTIYNHSSTALGVLVGGSVYELARTLTTAEPAAIAAVFTLVAGVAGSVVFFAVTGTLAVAAVSYRTGVPIRTIWTQDMRGVLASLIGLAPIGWLMAQTFQLPNGVGWWATPLFVVPLFTTRMSYARYVETRELFEQTIGALANAVDARDRYTRGHSNRVSHIAVAMSRVMRLAEGEIEKIQWAGLLHDIGKIGIRDNILLKEGPLDREERLLMNQHPTIGAEIVAPATQLSAEAPLIRAHHEWFNGSGYPDGVEALNIPLGARILTIADAYEAMTSSRPYRKTPLTHEQAIEQLEKYAGIQFDPNIVPVLVGLDREILDRPPDRPDELPTMLHYPDPRGATERLTPRLASTAEQRMPPTPPRLASDDVS